MLTIQNKMQHRWLIKILNSQINRDQSNEIQNNANQEIESANKKRKL